jgi:putative hydrolase of the HAD superfamily
VALVIPGSVVLFDYGEVISFSPSEADRAAILAAARVPVEGADAFWSAYWELRDDLDKGVLRVREYWTRVGAAIGMPWSLGEITALWAADFRSWISVETGTVDLIDELHEGGTRVALLSNAGFDFGSPFRHWPMAECFERVFVSAEMAALKPDPAIYLEVCEAMGIPPERLVFVDNKLVNVEGARSVGATAHHFEGVARLRRFLEDLAR